MRLLIYSAYYVLGLVMGGLSISQIIFHNRWYFVFSAFVCLCLAVYGRIKISQLK